ncbi:MAG: AAA family ATPase [Elusimicrobiaceae bacterium]
MKKLSEVSVLAWNIAGAEAISANFTQIEKEHVFISLTEIEKLLSLTSAKLKFDDAQVRSAAAEYSDILKVFEKLNLDPRKLRRNVRRRLGDGGRNTVRGDIHRSADCRAVFERAEQISGVKPVITGLDLFAALMNTPGRVITEVLSHYGVEPSKLLEVVNEMRMSGKTAAVFEEKPAEPVKIGAAESKPARSPYAPPDDWRPVVAAARPAPPKNGVGYVPPKHADKLLRVGLNLVKRASEKVLFPAVQREKEVRAVVEILNRNVHKMPLLVGPEGVGKSALVRTLAIKIWDGSAPEVMRDANIFEFSLSDILSADQDNAVDFFKGMIAEAHRHPSVFFYISDIHNFLRDGSKFGELLKDAVMEKGIRVIGGTTPEGYSSEIEQDARFSVFFEKVDVKEPEQAAAVEILRDNKTRVEIKGGGRITDKALLAAYTLSAKLAMPGVMPKKALNLLRSTCERARQSDAPALENIFIDAARKYDLLVEPGIHELWVCQTAAETLGIPLERAAAELSGKSPVRPDNIGRNIKGGIIGQNEAVEIVSRRLASAASSSGKRTGKPLVFYFAGPRGVGKTELAKHIAVTLFGSEESLYIFDMSKYGREESLRRIFGNREVEGRLFVAVKESPFSVILFENVDKTLPMFYNLIASFIEESASHGLDLRNTIFVFTSGTTGDESARFPGESEIMADVRRRLPTGIQHHISDIVPFKPLSVQSANLIMLKWLDEVRTTMKKEYGVSIQVGRDVERVLIKSGLSAEFGVRKLRMVFDQVLMQPLQRIIASGIVAKTKQWKFQLNENHVVLMPRAETQTGK